MNLARQTSEQGPAGTRVRRHPPRAPERRGIGEPLLSFQRTQGNRYVQGILNKAAMQRKGVRGAAGSWEPRVRGLIEARYWHEQSASTASDIQRAEADGKEEVPPTDAAINALDLAPKAKKAAQELKKNHPAIVFTSGRRDVAEQAHAMASNIVSSNNRKWIEQTYTAAAALQKWVDDNPEVKTVDALAKGLQDTMNAMSDSDRGKVSKHLSGEAFDVQPQEKDADTIKADIRALPDLSTFLEKEGGLERWHAQFKRSTEILPARDRYERGTDEFAKHLMRSGALDLG